MLRDIKMLSMPECVEIIESNENIFYVVVVDNKQYNDNEKSKLGSLGERSFGYVLFKRRQSTNFCRGYDQESIVLISKFLYVELFFQLIYHIVDALEPISPLCAEL